MTPEQVQEQRRSVQTIHDVVNATRAIAAGRIHAAQQVLATAQHYHAVVLSAAAAILAELGSEPPQPAGRRTALLVFTAAQPLCGALNQNVLTLAERRLRELRQVGAVDLLVVGERGARMLMARDIVPDGGEAAVTSLQGLRDLVKRLAAGLSSRYASSDLGALRVIYSRYVSVSEQLPVEEQILPLDFSAMRKAVPSPQPRYFHYLSAPALLEGILTEYAFISLYRIATEAYASEQAARLVAMDAATRNTEHMLDALLDRERRARHEQITRQVLDVIGARFAAQTPAVLYGRAVEPGPTARIRHDPSKSAPP